MNISSGKFAWNSIIKRYRALILSIFLILLFIIGWSIRGFFVMEAYASEVNNPDPARFVDRADLLSEDAEQKLDERLREVAEEYQCDVVVITTESMEGKTATSYADDFFDHAGYGYGENWDGILFLISMDEREWAISTTGFGIEAFTDAGQKYMTEQILPFLKKGEYGKAFHRFADLSERFLKKARGGAAYDAGNMPKETPGLTWILGAFAGGFLLSFIVAQVKKSKLRSVYRQISAEEYIIPNSFNLRRSENIYSHTNTTRTKIERSSSGGRGGYGGGSSTHRSSSGRTHGGSSGSF